MEKEDSAEINKENLVAGLNPIKNMFLAQVLNFCFQHNLIEYFVRNKTVTAAGLVEMKSWDEFRSEALLQYLANENFFERVDDTFVATSRCRDILPMWPWYRLLVGGYGETLQDLTPVLSDRSSYALRNGAEVGVGSCGISQHDALLMIIEMLSPILDEIDLIVDIGCGDGSFLLDLCERVPSLNGLGIEPEPESVKLANDEAAKRKLEDRVKVVCGSAGNIPISEDDDRRICYLTAFVLQEILEQRGRDALLRLIESRIRGRCNRYWAVVEVRNEFDNSEIMKDELAAGYYNPYFFIHCLTQQRLEKTEFWEKLFFDAGASVIGRATPHPVYDDTALKVGFLLTGANVVATTSEDP